MRKIFKYSLSLKDKQRVKLPAGYEVLSIQVQGYEIQLWALVDPDMPERELAVFCVGTGQDFWIDNEAQYPAHLGTVQQDGFVWHFFIYGGESA